MPESDDQNLRIREETMSTWPARVSDEAVSAATGKDWSEWFAVLDEEGPYG